MNARRRLHLLIAVCTSAVALSAPSALAASGPVAAYGFDEPSGSAVTDASGTGNDGSISGATRSASGRFGRALAFDGVNDRVTIPDSASLDLTGAMTLEAWVRPSRVDDWRTVVFKERFSGAAWALYASAGAHRPLAEGAGVESRGPSPLPVDRWSHLAATYDGAKLRLFVNGAQVASRTSSAGLATSSGALRIGGNAVWGDYFKGRIDEVRVYDRALTAGEIGTDMTTPVADTTPPTVSLPNLCNATTISGYGTFQVAYADDRGPVTLSVEVDGQTIYGPAEAPDLSGTRLVGWNTTTVANGLHTMVAIARDGAGNETRSANCVWDVQNQLGIRFLSPSAGSTVSGTVTLAAVGLVGGFPDPMAPIGFVVFTAAGVDLGPDSSAPYEVTWDSTTVANGTHTLTADAYQPGGSTPRATTSIQVQVEN